MTTKRKTRHLDFSGVKIVDKVDSGSPLGKIQIRNLVANGRNFWQPLFFRLDSGATGALLRGDLYLRPADIFETVDAELWKKLSVVRRGQTRWIYARGERTRRDDRLCPLSTLLRYIDEPDARTYLENFRTTMHERVFPDRRPRRQREREEKQHAGMLRAHAKMKDWRIDGHSPRITKPRKRIVPVEAKSLKAGQRVRISFFDYEKQGQITDFATIKGLVYDPGCPWNRFVVPESVHLLLECSDGTTRSRRIFPPDELVEIDPGAPVGAHREHP